MPAYYAGTQILSSLLSHKFLRGKAKPHNNLMVRSIRIKPEPQD